MAAVEVQPSDLPPVRYKGQVFIRIGPRRAIASDQEERLLSERRVTFARSFDARPCHETSLESLALGQFDAYRRQAIAPEILEANNRPVEQQLASLRFYDPVRARPTPAGILLFGRTPRFHLPSAYVQYLRLPSPMLSDPPEDQAEISGDLLSVVRELFSRVNVMIQTAMVNGQSFQQLLVPNYPEWALRELLMNTAQTPPWPDADGSGRAETDVLPQVR